MIPENSNNGFYECEKIEIIPTGNEEMAYKYTVEKINATRLSSIIRNILLEKPLKASYAIEELFNYNCRDEMEKQLWNEAKTCFDFKEKNRLVDLKKYFFNFRLVWKMRLTLNILTMKCLLKQKNYHMLMF